MNNKLISLIRRMDTKTPEAQMALQCAPLIVGLRMSNLLFIRNGQIKRIQELLKRRGICLSLLYREREKSVVFLYYREELGKYLAKTDVRKFLMECGYGSAQITDILSLFGRRYHAYRQGLCDFPHEIGVLLGYPLEDVRGFIDNAGQNYLYSGYWKVYRDVEEKKEIFCMYEFARETLVEFVCHGTGMKDIIDAYKEK